MSDKENMIQKLSYSFAIEIIKLYQKLEEKRGYFPLTKQLLRCGTAIGANVEEAIGGQSKKDFIAKMYIAHKEARETNYRLSLLRDTGYLSQSESDYLQSICSSIINITGKILSTAKSSLQS